MLEFFQRFDMSNNSPTLSVNKDIITKTAYGGVLSILLFMLSILCIVGFGLDMVTRQNPIVAASDTLLYDLPEMKRDQYEFAISLMEGNNREIASVERLFSIVAVLTNVTNGIRSQSIFALEKCINNENYNSTFFNYTIINMRNYFCLPKSINHTLVASSSKPTYLGMRIEVNYCTNTTNYTSCYERPHDKFYFVHFIYRNVFVDSNDFANPLKTNFDSDFIRLSTSFDTSYKYTYSNIDYISDNGIILKSKNVYSDNIHTRTESNASFDTKSKRLFYAVIQMGQLKKSTFRYYQKIQKVAADVGGIIEFFSIIFTFIASKYSEIKFYSYFSYFSNNLYKKNDSFKIKFDDINENKDSHVSKFNININKNNVNVNVNSNAHAHEDKEKVESSNLNLNFSNNIRRNTETVLNKTLPFISAKISTTDNKEFVEIQKLDVVKILDEKLKLSIENFKMDPLCNTIFDDKDSFLSILKTLPPFTWCCYKDYHVNLNLIKSDYIKSISVEKMIEIQRKLDLVEQMCCFGNDEIIKIFKQQVK